MRRLHRFSIRHPVLVVSLAAVVTVAIAPGILRLELRTDGQALVPERAAAVQLDREVRGEFGVSDPIVVLLRPRHRDGVLEPGTLRLVVSLTAELKRIPGLDPAAVRSLATEVSDRYRPGTLQFRGLLEPVPETRAQLTELRGDIAAVGLYTGTLISFDGRSTAIHVGVPPEADRAGLLVAIRGVIADADNAGHDIDLIGAPVAEVLLGTHILEDLGVHWGALASSSSSSAAAAAPESGLAARLRSLIARHIGLLPLSVLCIAVVFLLWFRSFSAMLLPLMEAGACLVFVFGLMGWTGVPVYLTMAVLPVILVSMGLADELHVFTRYRQHLAARPGASVVELVSATLDDMVLPVVATSLTTAVGFLSFAISPLGPVRAFGLFTAAGILFCMLWTLTVIPAMLILLGGSRARAQARSRAVAASAGPEGWRWLAAWAWRWPAVTLSIAVLALALTPFGIRRIEVQDSWLSGFARQSEFYRATQYFNRQFFGTHRLLLALATDHVDLRGRMPAADLGHQELRLPRGLSADPAALVGCSLVLSRTPTDGAARGGSTGLAFPATWESIVEGTRSENGRTVLITPPVHGSALFMLRPAPHDSLEYVLRSQGFKLPRVLDKVEGLENFVRGQVRYTVGGVLGPTDQLKTAQFLIEGRAPGSRAIPSNPDRVRWLWNSLAQVRGTERVREMVDSTYQRALVTVFLKHANYVDTARLMAAIREHERTALAPDRIRLEFAGDVAVSQALIEGIVRSQVGSLLLSLLGILLVIAVLFRSLRWGLLCMVPAGVSVAATFAVMGAVGMPLGVATSMFAAMVLGIGVDFAIHLVERFRAAMARGIAREAAVLESLQATGPAIVVNALAVSLGFGILVFSRVPANVQLGAITLLSLLTCVAATLLVIPALLSLEGRRGRAGSTSPTPS